MGATSSSGNCCPMKIKFMEGAWNDYLSWQSDKAMLRKINRLIQDIQRSPFEESASPNRCGINFPAMVAAD